MSKDLKQTTFLFGSNSVFVEELYQQYLQNPDSVDSSWVEFFEHQNDSTPLKSTARVITKDTVEQTDSKLAVYPAGTNSENALRAKFMIMAYREHGHYLANLDPLGLERKKTKEELKLNIEDFGFSQDQLSTIINIKGELSDIEECSLSELVAILERTYCDSVAVEFTHLQNVEHEKWLYDQLENANTHNMLSNDDRQQILKDLAEIEGFEQYLHTKFPGAKRFSIEGGDSSIICLDKVIEEDANNGVEEVVLGLAHRGRLSTLTKVMQKPYRAVLSEFLGSSAFPTDLDIAGDVKYHMGYSSDKVTKSGKEIHLSLTPNPSHLEAVNPVVAGKVRAKQDLKNRDRSKVTGILIHGDTAFCGQGIVAESLVMSGLNAFDIGGIFHIIINNQIGFTVNNSDSRPGRYCTEVAKMVGAPILHVNGDDVEAVFMATKIACDYRKKFGRDIVIDIICYRKYGHNEGDEPMYTQSTMYNIIKQKQTPAAIYAEKLIAQGVIDKQFYPDKKQNFKKYLDDEFKVAKDYKPRAQWLEGKWSGFDRHGDQQPITGVDKEKLQQLGIKLCNIPKNFDLNKKLAKLFAARAEVLKDDQPIDWATAEQLAFATLLSEKMPIRITGQDVERGTFSHRHAVLHSQSNSSSYEPLNNISEEQAYFEIANSHLSEFGVLGFEYGYSLVNPNQLVIWEAQFGDFANGAQIIFDQFISSAETKWLRMSGLTVMLPHSFEGQGPEHSSARLERLLQLSAENNMQVAYPTTPASIFHLLRRQVSRNFRKPLMIMSPKSLLRNKLAVSKLDELAVGTAFQPIIDEVDSVIKPAKAKKVVFCSGKVYYDLLDMRMKNNIKNVAIIRLEQLYPFEQEVFVEMIKKYKGAAEFVWCQEEPKNMGAWKYVHYLIEDSLKLAGIKKKVEYVGRKRSASPAVGYLYVHNKEQEVIVKSALGLKI